MKRIILPFLLLFLGSLSWFSQGKAFNSQTIYLLPDSAGPGWDSSALELYSYDHSLLSKALRKVYLKDSFTLESRRSFSYNDSAKLVRMLKERYAGGAWNNAIIDSISWNRFGYR